MVPIGASSVSDRGPLARQTGDRRVTIPLFLLMGGCTDEPRTMDFPAATASEPAQSRRLGFEGLEGRQLLATSRALWGSEIRITGDPPILESVLEFRGGNFSPNSCPRSAAHLAK